jgi:hypothetical protein
VVGAWVVHGGLPYRVGRGASHAGNWGARGPRRPACWQLRDPTIFPCPVLFLSDKVEDAVGLFRTACRTRVEGLHDQASWRCWITRAGRAPARPQRWSSRSAACSGRWQVGAGGVLTPAMDWSLQFTRTMRGFSRAGAAGS